MKNKILKSVAILLSFLTFLSCENMDFYSDKIGPSLPSKISLSTLSYDDVTGIRTLELTWTDPSDTDFDHIEILDMTGKVIKEVGKNVEYATFENNDIFYDIFDIQNNTNAQYRIRSVDTAGNKSKTTPLVSKWVMAYFKSEGSYSSNTSTSKTQNSLYLATSNDGLNYTAVNGGNPVLTVPASVGSGGQCIRDPYIFRKNDGTFIMIATDWTPFCGTSNTAYGTTATSSYWGTSSPCVIVADSTDLINWTAVRCRVLAKQTDGTVLAGRHMWAPEVVKINKYDSYTEDDAYDYGVIWSGNFSADGIEDGSPEDYINRTYISYTNDFDTFSTPVLFFQDDYTGTVVTEIDANVVLWGDKYYMFFKNEADDGKDIALSVSDSLKPLSFSVLHNGEYISRDKAQSTGVGIEGSWVVYVDGVWWMFGDHYGNTSTSATTNFYAWSSSDISASPELWTRHANDGTYTIPAGARHAIALRLTSSEYSTLKSASSFTVTAE